MMNACQPGRHPESFPLRLLIFWLDPQGRCLGGTKHGLLWGTTSKPGSTNVRVAFRLYSRLSQAMNLAIV